MQLILLSHYFTLAWLCHRCQLGWISRRGGSIKEKQKTWKKPCWFLLVKLFTVFLLLLLLLKNGSEKNKTDFLNVKWHIDGVTERQQGGSNRTILGVVHNWCHGSKRRGVNLITLLKPLLKKAWQWGEGTQKLLRIAWRHLWTNSYQINCDDRLKLRGKLKQDLYKKTES